MGRTADFHKMHVRLYESCHLCGVALEFSMMGYGLAAYCARLGKKETSQSICQKILQRDRFWISFGYLATWNDCKA